MSEVMARRATEAVLERVASSLDHEMPMIRQELILSGTGQRIYRLSHPTALDEDLYVRVVVETMDRTEVMQHLQPGPVDRLIEENRHVPAVDDEPTQLGTWGPWGPEGRPPSPDQLD